MGGRSVNEADLRVADRVKKARVAAGLSQVQIAKALEISFQQVQKYENGKNRWSAGMLQLAADRIGVPVADFFEPSTAVPEAPPQTVAQAEARFIAASYALAEAKAREAAALQVAA
ncbi:helix-turn-helix transcriptional regulator [Methylobacterium organophilum]|uniref:helix-turn-helix domain-containing protein n=1 Tax=Methylobacterium TaxID=407 RepID=UPI0019D24532|nr:helix-turn-helix transcriptional regulator [Methylobacterium organophilum]MBN6819581.1 helix-turn-helix transcriptional regulator [Methylobacterium organophilum]